MATHANRVQMTVSGTPGTGTITLGSASSGYRTFASAYGANATVDVLIVDGTAWEVARGCTYTNSGTTLSRGTLESSSTGSAVAFTSAAIVSVILPASTGNAIENFLGAWGALSGENSITGTATAAIGRLNVCSGTTADYTVTLPAVSGNSGKYIGILGDSGLTKVVTIDANSTELIDYNQTLPIIARDAYVLYCNGSKWIVLASMPRQNILIVQNNGSTTQSLSSGTSTKIANALTTVSQDALSEWNGTNKKFTPKRAGKYLVTLGVQNDNVSSILAVQLYKNGTIYAQGNSAAASTYQQAYCSFQADANGSTDYFECYCYSSASCNTNAYTTAVQFIASYIGRA